MSAGAPAINLTEAKANRAIRAMAEPSDDSAYDITIWGPSLGFYIAAAKFYEELLGSDLAAISADPDLNAILGAEDRERFEIYQELERVKRAREWLEAKRSAGKNHHWLHISHGFVRFIKASGFLYLKHLQNRRNRLAAKPSISRHALEAVDSKLASLRETVTTGVFQNATPSQLSVDEMLQVDSPGHPPAAVASADTSTPRPVVLATIEIFDPDLRFRCLDLFNSFESAGQRDRLDTVITEATRILEDKLRKLSGAPEGTIGLDLVNYAVGGESPRLKVSDLRPEQQAVGQLFRGVFGLMRNAPHHRLLGELQPGRVVQILGVIDHCIFIAQGAIRTEPSAPADSPTPKP